MEGTEIASVIFSFITVVIFIILIVLYVKYNDDKSCCDDCAHNTFSGECWHAEHECRHRSGISPIPTTRTTNSHIKAMTLPKNAYSSPSLEVSHFLKQPVLVRPTNPEYKARVDGNQGMYLPRYTPQHCVDRSAKTQTRQDSDENIVMTHMSRRQCTG